MKNNNNITYTRKKQRWVQAKFNKTAYQNQSHIKNPHKKNGQTSQKKKKKGRGKQKTLTQIAGERWILEMRKHKKKNSEGGSRQPFLVSL